MRADDTPKTEPRTLLGRVCLVLVMLFMGVLFSAMGVGRTVHSADGLKYSTRTSGTPGLLKIFNCAASGTGRQQRTTCFGKFQSDDHRVVDDFSSIDGSYKEGTVLPVQRDGDGDCREVGVAPIAGQLAMICFSAVGLMAGLASFCSAFSTAMPRTGSRIGAVLWPPRAARMVGRLCIALGIGAAVFGAVSLIGWLAMP
ncbi:hypothetical protein ACIQFZ_38450 [Streptomyces sp. NPDC093064]|uniref:hypothetical protein n=1 Tax=Streptomyces sp. NPDC093064 TaxID=3366020 RepID=UPI003819C0AA